MSTDGVDSAGESGGSSDNDNSEPSISEDSRDSLDGGGNDNNNDNDGPSADAHGSDTASEPESDDDGDDDAAHGYDEVGTDVPANDPHEPTPAERAASQDRMQAEAQAAKQAYESQQGDLEDDQGYADALDQEVSAQTAAATAADRIDAHTTSKNQRGGAGAVETIHTDRIAADIVHMAQTDPVGAQAVYDAAQRQLGDAAAMQASLETELARDRLASDTLLGDTAYEPPAPQDVTIEAERLVEAHTSTFGTRGGTTREVFDVNSMSYEIEQMALDDPSMAAAVRAELARDLTAAQASNMNRMIAGDANWEENLEIGFENPVDGVIGIGKGIVNGVSDVVELAAKGVAYGDALGDMVTAEVAEFAGLDGVAAAYDGMAAFKNERAAAVDVPEFDLTNRAQQGGAVMGTIIDIGLGGKGLVTGAARLAAKNADEVAGLATKQSGARITDPHELAEVRYDEIRESTVDVARIAENTGWKAENIQKVKDHVFYDEHLLDRLEPQVPATRGRFDADPEMADAWERLEEGTFTTADVELMKHELAERFIETSRGSGYKEAHERANQSFRTPFEPLDN